MGPRDGENGDITIDNGHISGHFIEGSADCHAISQEIHSGDSTMISFTDVDADGNVGASGFDSKD